MEEISNKTKIILIILSMIPITIVIFFIGLIIVNAETLSTSASLSYAHTGNETAQVIYSGSSLWANHGQGQLEFTLLVYKESSNTSFSLPLITGIVARSGDSNMYECTYGSIDLEYSQSSSNMKGYFVPVICNMSMGSNGLTRIGVTFSSSTNTWTTIASGVMTFTKDGTAIVADRTQYIYAYLQNYVYPKLNEIDQNTTTSANELQYIYAYLQNYIYTALNSTSSAINNQTTTINNNHDELMDADIDDTSKQNVDQTQYNNYKQKEDTLMQSTQQADLTNLSIGIDADTSSTIWQLITRIIQQNAKVFSLFISILSIGIIKLVLAR